MAAALPSSGPGDAGADPVVRQYRERISDNDRALVDALNGRIKLVRELKAYKERAGHGFVDPRREEMMLAYLVRANRGPLTEAGLRDFFAAVLAITKTELGEGDATSG